MLEIWVALQDRLETDGALPRFPAALLECERWKQGPDRTREGVNTVGEWLGKLLI